MHGHIKQTQIPQIKGVNFSFSMLNGPPITDEFDSWLMDYG
jgi:hypothetical protein